jgi:hypothetical protein
MALQHKQKTAFLLAPAFLLRNKNSIWNHAGTWIDYTGSSCNKPLQCQYARTGAIASLSRSRLQWIYAEHRELCMHMRFCYMNTHGNAMPADPDGVASATRALTPHPCTLAVRLGLSPRTKMIPYVRRKPESLPDTIRSGQTTTASSARDGRQAVCVGRQPRTFAFFCTYLDNLDLCILFVSLDGRTSPGQPIVFFFYRKPIGHVD